MLSTYLLISPMICVLLSIAFMPLLAPKFWSKNELFFLLIVSVFSIIVDFAFIPNTSALLGHSIFYEYIPFIIMLFTLYTLSNGIHIKVNTIPTTFANIIFLAIGSLLSSLIGTTGAAMLLSRPFLLMNGNRQNKTHLIIFFILIIANIGGLLTPLGDPPLLLGYLHGVEFSWTIIHLYKYWFIYIISCLIILYFVDKHFIETESIASPINKTSIQIKGYTNIFLILFTAFILFINIDISTQIYGINIPTVYFKDSILLFISYVSIKNQNKEQIDFEPFIEVVQTFLVIFIVLAPVLFLMEQNVDNIQKFVSKLNGNSLPHTYFLLCSLASSFLDNAPSYLLFVKMTGYSIENLMTENAQLLIAISVSSVVMGSLTYIGNAPNMMVKNIAQKYNIRMPSFISYFGIACSIIIPISIIANKLLNFQ